jgi:hypothetical protein
MKRVSLIVLLAFVLGLPLYSLVDAVVVEVSGKVEVKPPGEAWLTAAAGMTIEPGAVISTGFRSQALLEVGESTLQVKQLTRMQLEELVQREGLQTTQLFLRVGKIRADVKTAEGLRHDFQLRSPVSTAAVRGTIFEYDGIRLNVERGLVFLANTLNHGHSVSGNEEGEARGFDKPKKSSEIKKSNSGVSAFAGGRGKGRGRGGDGPPPGRGPNKGPKVTGKVKIKWKKTLTAF